MIEYFEIFLLNIILNYGVSNPRGIVEYYNNTSTKLKWLDWLFFQTLSKIYVLYYIIDERPFNKLKTFFD